MSGQFYGVSLEDWLRIRDERDRLEATLRRIAASDRRTKRETLRRWAAKGLNPDMSYEMTRFLIRGIGG